MDNQKAIDDFIPTTANVRAEMLAAIGRADAAGIDGHTLDRMRLACEYLTDPEFRRALNDRVANVMGFA